MGTEGWGILVLFTLCFGWLSYLMSYLMIVSPVIKSQKKFFEFFGFNPFSGEGEKEKIQKRIYEVLEAIAQEKMKLETKKRLGEDSLDAQSYFEREGTIQAVTDKYNQAKKLTEQFNFSAPTIEEMIAFLNLKREKKEAGA